MGDTLIINRYEITFKVCFKQPLTREEEAIYLATMATKAEKKRYFKHKKEVDKAYNRLVKELKK